MKRTHSIPGHYIAARREACREGEEPITRPIAPMPYFIPGSFRTLCDDVASTIERIAAANVKRDAHTRAVRMAQLRFNADAEAERARVQSRQNGAAHDRIIGRGERKARKARKVVA